MKIINDYYNQNEIKDFIEKSAPNEDSTFSVLKILEEAGWVDIRLKNNDKEFSIKYSSVMTDSSDLFEFLANIIHSEEDIALILDNEGSNPLLYAKTIGSNILFLFAQDYELFRSFLRDEIDDFELSEYKVDCDILINKKYLLEEFYKILFPYLDNYKYNASDEYGYEFNIEKAKKCLDKIKKFLNA